MVRNQCKLFVLSINAATYTVYCTLVKPKQCLLKVNVKWKTKPTTFVRVLLHGV